MILPRTSEGLYLLQRVRDEAHRFAITYHRQKRSQGDDGERAGRRPRAGRDAAQGAAATLRLAEAAAGGRASEEVMEVPGIGRRTAEAVVAALRRRDAGRRRRSTR